MFEVRSADLSVGHLWNAWTSVATPLSPRRVSGRISVLSELNLGRKFAITVAPADPRQL